MNPTEAQLRTFADIHAYYDAVPAARRSGESDYGVWWRDEAGGNWRITWVHDTGEIYAIRLGPTTIQPIPEIGGIRISAGSGHHEGPVLVVGRIEREEDVERAFDGWAEKCGQHRSLEWILERVRGQVEA